MIITVQGTHGSGKSTVVRKVMENFPLQLKLHKWPRRRPMGYKLTHPVKDHRPLFIPGHYETPCGGCDTIPIVNDTYGLIRHYAVDHDVLFEGILAQHSTPNLLSLRNLAPIALVLNITDEEAIQAVTERRLARGDDRPLNPNNIIKENQSIRARLPKLEAAGFSVIMVSREQAVISCLEFLKVSEYGTVAK